MKRILLLSLALLMLFTLVGCGGSNSEPVQEVSVGDQTTNVEEINEEVEETTKTITYLGTEYEVPYNTERIVITGSLESMEDALVLGVNPVGAISVGGKFPDMFSEIVGNSVSSGEKTQPNYETILQLKPDVILGTTKFQAEVTEQLSKIATYIPVSHLSDDWDANLLLLGELAGKESEAEAAIEAYYKDLELTKATFESSLQDKEVVVVRIRKGNLFIYSEDVFFNPMLYLDLELKVPEVVQAAASQENISLEAFSQVNPDYIFLQFAEDENPDNLNALEELQNNPIWQSMEAVKEDRVFVNVVDPMAQGGTAWSKFKFLEAFVESLSY
jgi:iron complex transport system substrate-binding protein